MYLNRLKIGSIQLIDTVLLWVAGFLYFFDVVGFSSTIFELKDDHEMFVVGLVMSTIILFIAVCLTACPIMSKKMLERAEKYNRIFEEDHDGMVSYENFSQLTGFPIQTVRSDIRKMYKKKIFKNITYGFEGAMIIMKADTAGDFINVECPHCGAQVTMRMNGGARCPHCGTYLRSES